VINCSARLITEFAGKLIDLGVIVGSVSVDSYNPITVASRFAVTGWEPPQVCNPNEGDCVEVNLTDSSCVAVRDSKLTASPVLVFTNGEWRRFLEAALGGTVQPVASVTRIRLSHTSEQLTMASPASENRTHLSEMSCCKNY
jgi:hypothetical protein